MQRPHTLLVPSATYIHTGRAHLGSNQLFGCIHQRLKKCLECLLESSGAVACGLELGDSRPADNGHQLGSRMKVVDDLVPRLEGTHGLERRDRNLQDVADGGEVSLGRGAKAASERIDSGNVGGFGH
eukprot:3968528-Prymnesium_polylepis.1